MQDLCASLFTAASSVRVKNGKQSSCLSIRDSVSQLCYTGTIKNAKAIKKDNAWIQSGHIVKFKKANCKSVLKEDPILTEKIYLLNLAEKNLKLLFLRVTYTDISLSSIFLSNVLVVHS